MLFDAQASGTADALTGFADQCLAEYDLNGWTVPDLSDAEDIAVFRRNGHGS